jgi:hypothetical protein
MVGFNKPDWTHSAGSVSDPLDGTGTSKINWDGTDGTGAAKNSFLLKTGGTHTFSATDGNAIAVNAAITGMKSWCAGKTDAELKSGFGWPEPLSKHWNSAANAGIALPPPTVHLQSARYSTADQPADSPADLTGPDDRIRIVDTAITPDGAFDILKAKAEVRIRNASEISYAWSTCRRRPGHPSSPDTPYRPELSAYFPEAGIRDNFELRLLPSKGSILDINDSILYISLHVRWSSFINEKWERCYAVVRGQCEKGSNQKRYESWKIWSEPSSTSILTTPSNPLETHGMPYKSSQFDDPPIP